MKIFGRGYTRRRFYQGDPVSHLPRWAVDGGWVSPASVGGMREIDFETAWRLLRLTVAPLYGYNMDAEVFADWMDGIYEALKDQSQEL